jgi:acetolactate synthase-1/2/3 large subunit
MVFEQAYTRYPAFRIEPDPALIREAVKLIDGAQRPVIVAGGGAVASSAQSAITDFAERFSVPVASSCDGKGVVPDTHPLSAGVVGSYSAKCANQIVSESDLVIYIGSAVGDQVTHNWKIPEEGTQIIQIDINPSELGRSYRSTLGILGDARVTVEKLNQEMGDADAKESWAAHARQLVEQWRREVEPLRRSKAVPMRPERLCKELTEVLPKNAIVVSDTGYSAIWSATMLDLTHPEQRYVRAAGSLGWAFPASLGAKCGAPERPVVCFTGDGALWYHIADLETAKRWGINTVTVVNNNSGYGQSQVGVKKAYGKSSGDPGHLYRFERINFARLADEIGCLGIRVESPDDVAGAVRQALAANQPAVVDVVTDVGSTAANPWEPGV